MNVLLKPELEQFVDEQVKSGRYASTEDVFAAALMRLKQQPADAFDFAPGEMDALIAEGEASFARGETVSMEEIREYFRRKAAQYK